MFNYFISIQLWSSPLFQVAPPFDVGVGVLTLRRDSARVCLADQSDILPRTCAGVDALVIDSYAADKIQHVLFEPAQKAFFGLVVHFLAGARRRRDVAAVFVVLVLQILEVIGICVVDPGICRDSQL